VDESGSAVKGVQLPLWVKVSLGAMLGLVVAGWTLLRLAESTPLTATVVFLLLGVGTLAGGFAAYFAHRFRHLPPLKRWAATGGATGLILGAIAVDLGQADLWTLPITAAAGAAVSLGLSFYFTH